MKELDVLRLKDSVETLNGYTMQLYENMEDKTYEIKLWEDGKMLSSREDMAYKDAQQLMIGAETVDILSILQANERDRQ